MESLRTKDASAGAAPGVGSHDKRSASAQGRNHQQQSGPQEIGNNAPHKYQQHKSATSEMKLANMFQGVKEEELDPTAVHKNFQWLGTKKAMQQSQFQKQRNIKQRGRGGGGGRGGQGGRPNYDLWGDEVIQSESENPWLTDALYFKYEKPHAESLREAKPITFPTNRANPPKEFVEAHQVFAYVSHVPRPVVDGELGSYDNPMHRHEVVEFVANVFSVPATNVFCANMTSAFVGFQDAKEAAKAMVESHSNRIITGKEIKPKIYAPIEKGADVVVTEEESKFVQSAPSPEAVVRIDHIPAGMRAGTVARVLYNAVVIDPKHIFISSPTSALIQFKSKEEASDFVHKFAVQKSLATLQRQILRVQAAKREVVHDKFTGPVRQFQQKKMTDKLVVDGDVPSKDFFLSHASVLHLCNVPITASKQDISKHFQKFCVEPRDVDGSIEIVTSTDGHPTGRVYVGFDLESEGTKAWSDILASGQNIMFNEAGPAVRVRPVKDVALVRGAKLGARSERTAEELIASFTAWKDYVDPKDIETLESFGVTMDVLEEAFSAARRNNPTFGVEDQAREGERMRMEHSPGGHFKEFVQEYIDTLKELAATKEDPGLKYKAMFLPDEEMEYSLFDAEENRLAALRKEYRS